MTTGGMDEQFVGDPIKPVVETFDAARMTRGEPGLPGKFVWRGEEYTVAETLETWKQTGPCRHGSRERYVRKHFYRVRTTSGHEMVVYFERQKRASGKTGARWWLYRIVGAEDEER